jgi:AcrR family transcriptional regulator
VAGAAEIAEATAASRGRRPRKTSGDDRERAILATAERLLEERSVHEISVDDLARGAGISRPTFYFYFADKEAVVLTLLDRLIEEARTGIRLDRLKEDPRAAIRAGISSIHQTFRAHRAVARAAIDLRARSSAVKELWSGVMERFVAETAAAIESERERGAALAGVPARDLAAALNWMNERVLAASFEDATPAVAEEELIDTLLAVWLRAIYGSDHPTGAAGG